MPNYILYFDAGRGQASALSSVNWPNEATRRLLLENDGKTVNLVDVGSYQGLVDKVRSEDLGDSEFARLLNEPVGRFWIDGYQGKAKPVNDYAKRLMMSNDWHEVEMLEEQVYVSSMEAARMERMALKPANQASQKKPLRTPGIYASLPFAAMAANT